MEKNAQKSKIIPVLIAYSILFYGIWTLNEFFVKPFMQEQILNESVCALVKGLFKSLVWILPAALLVHHFRDKVYVTLKTMFTGKANWLKWLPVFLCITAYYIVSAVTAKGGLKLADGFGLPLIITDLFVGITEEMVFRGWLLNVTLPMAKKPWIPVAVNSLMFLMIHFPIWIMNGVFLQNLASSWALILLSILFSFSFIKSKNILVPTALHMYWDLLSWMFFG